MRYSTILILGLISSAQSNNEDPESVTRHLSETVAVAGRFIEFEVGAEKLQIEAYRGIQYGFAPTGSQRFKESVASQSVGGDAASVINARHWRKNCIETPLFGERLKEPPISQDEDCLFLNVFVPMKAQSAALAVLVWLPGQQYSVGSARDPNIDQNRLLEGFLSDRNLILVSVQYRHGPFGWFTYGDPVAPGNAALGDVLLALRWLQSNLAAFGGNRDRVTVIGEGSAAHLLSLLSVSPKSEGLFQRAIQLDGGALSPWYGGGGGRKSARGVVEWSRLLAAEYLDCDIPSAEQTLHCLTTRSSLQIANAVKEMMSVTADETMLPFHPNWNDEWFSRPLETLFSGKRQAIDILIGVSATKPNVYLQNDSAVGFFEFRDFTKAMLPNFVAKNAPVLRKRIVDFYLDVEGESKRDSNFVFEKFMEMLMDYNMFLPVLKEGMLRKAAGDNVNVFAYESNSLYNPRRVPKSEHTVVLLQHLLHEQFFFKNCFVSSQQQTSDLVAALCAKMTKLFVDFARNGKLMEPELANLWKAADETSSVMHLGAKKNWMINDFRRDVTHLWSEVETAKKHSEMTSFDSKSDNDDVESQRTVEPGHDEF